MKFKDIPFLKGAHGFCEVDEGYSDCYKYTFIKNNKTYFIKIGCFQVVDNLEEILSDALIPHPQVIEFKKYDDNYNYIILEFIEGKNFRDSYSSYHHKFIFEYGFLLGEKYHNLREKFPDKKMDQKNTLDYYDSALKMIGKTNLYLKDNHDFPKDELDLINYVINFLSDKTLLKKARLVYGHTDIKGSNFILKDNMLYATDIEGTRYKEISLSLRFAFARNDYNDEKNIAFTSGYLNALYNFNIPKEVLDMCNYTYLYGFLKYVTAYIEDDKVDKLKEFIKHVKSYYFHDGEIIVGKKILDYLDLSSIKKIKNSKITLVRDSYNPYNLTFKCENKLTSYFLKVMYASKDEYNHKLKCYDLFKNLNIPSSEVIDSGWIIKNQKCYVLFDYINLGEMTLSIPLTLKSGEEAGKLVASHLVKLKEVKEGFKVFSKDDIYQMYMGYIDKLYPLKEVSPFVHWKKDELVSIIDKLIKSFADEPINLIHADVKFANILYKDNSLCFVDNENLIMSYDIINFMYNIQNAFIDYKPHYRGFISSYLKYMNNGKVPKRVHDQAKLLFLGYIIRSVLNMQSKEDFTEKYENLLNIAKKYIDKDELLEWLC